MALKEASFEEEGGAQAERAEAEDRPIGAEREGGAVQRDHQLGLHEQGAAAGEGARGPGEGAGEEGGAPPAAAIEGEVAADALRSQGAELEAELGVQGERAELADRADPGAEQVQREVDALAGARLEAGGAAKPSGVGEAEAQARPAGAEADEQAGGDPREDPDGGRGAVRRSRRDRGRARRGASRARARRRSR